MMKPRPESLAARLKRIEALDDFFAYVASESPSYADMEAWIEGRGIATSAGAIHNLIAYHMSAWRVRQAEQAAQEELDTLPGDLASDIRRKIAGLKLDLAMRDLSTEEMLALIRIDQADAAQALKSEALRLDREKFEAQERRLAAASEAVQDEALSETERIAKIKAIFGLKA